MADAAVESLAVPMSGVEAAPQSAAPDYTGFDYPDVAFIDQAVISNAGDARGALKDLAGLPNLAEDLPGRVDLNTDRVTSNANIDQVTASLPFPGGVTLTKGERQPIQDSTRSVDSKQDKAEARQSDFDMAAQRVIDAHNARKDYRCSISRGGYDDERKYNFTIKYEDPSNDSLLSGKLPKRYVYEKYEIEDYDALPPVADELSADDPAIVRFKAAHSPRSVTFSEQQETETHYTDRSISVTKRDKADVKQGPYKWGMEEGSRRKVGSMEERRRYWQYVQIKDDAETMERRVKEITEPVRNLHFPFSLLRKIKNAA
jgi:hypothetical protein